MLFTSHFIVESCESSSFEKHMRNFFSWMEMYQRSHIYRSCLQADSGDSEVQSCVKRLSWHCQQIFYKHLRGWSGPFSFHSQIVETLFIFNLFIFDWTLISTILQRVLAIFLKHLNASIFFKTYQESSQKIIYTLLAPSLSYITASL